MIQLALGRSRALGLDQAETRPVSCNMEINEMFTGCLVEGKCDHSESSSFGSVSTRMRGEFLYDRRRLLFSHRLQRFFLSTAPHQLSCLPCCALR